MLQLPFVKCDHHEAVMFDGCVYCVECIPEGVDLKSEEVQPIFAGSEWDVYPVCDECGEEHTYVALTEEGRKRHSIGQTELHTWFERNRAHVELVSKKTGETIVEWWDEDVEEASVGGFLTLHKGERALHVSAYEYAVDQGKITRN